MPGKWDGKSRIPTQLYKDNYDRIFGKKDDKRKKVKKETTESKLAEIEKNGKIATLEMQINALEEIIEGKNQRISMVTEDDSLSELVDKKKMKEMQREVKLLEKKKAGMEKMYEKMCGKAYKRVMDEGSNDNSNLGSNENIKRTGQSRKYV